jgi:hypothetical protein
VTKQFVTYGVLEIEVIVSYHGLRVPRQCLEEALRKALASLIGPGAGRSRQELAGVGRSRQELAGVGRSWQELTGVGRSWQELTGGVMS